MSELNQYLPFKPTQEQYTVLSEINSFIEIEDPRKIMVLKGAAGTGKTSIMKAVKSMAVEKSINFKLSSPTGRAAKILHSKTNVDVKTVHSQIFTPEILKNGAVKLDLKTYNNDGRTIYIVDEASMLSDSTQSEGSFITDESILKSFLDYVNMSDVNSKILFVGDHYQLPPIVSQYERSFSPALDEEYLKKKFGCVTSASSLTEVKRQTNGSDVLDLATRIRKEIESGDTMYFEYPQRNWKWWDAKNDYMSSFSVEKLDKVMIICHTNKDVNFWNNEIRKELYGANGASNSVIRENEVVTISRNTWCKEGIIFNGDTGVIKRVNHNTKEFGGLNFNEVTIELDSYGEKNEIQTLVCLESLMSEKGSLRLDQESKLYAAVMQTNPVFRDSGNLQDDPYLSALRLRYGYATTCHKAQGGEWDTVYVHPCLDYIQRDRAKWLYTAYTRARKNLYSWN